MHFFAKCNSDRIAIQWFHNKHYLDYHYTKFQTYTSRVQKMCVFARYATLVPRLIYIDKLISMSFIVNSQACIIPGINSVYFRIVYESVGFIRLPNTFTFVIKATPKVSITPLRLP